MKYDNTCPCCANSMLHHLDGDRSYWFCRDCWLEFPDKKITKKKNSPISLNVRKSTKKNLVESKQIV